MQLVRHPKRRRGRPSLSPCGERTVSVHIRLPESKYDQIDRVARETGLTAPEIYRRGYEANERLFGRLQEALSALMASATVDQKSRAYMHVLSAQALSGRELTPEEQAEIATQALIAIVRREA